MDKVRILNFISQGICEHLLFLSFVMIIIQSQGDLEFSVGEYHCTHLLKKTGSGLLYL
jgi:hypothetical protein